MAPPSYRDVQISGRVYLEDLDPAKHLEDFHAVWSDPANLQWSARAPTASIHDSERFLVEEFLPPPVPADLQRIYAEDQNAVHPAEYTMRSAVMLRPPPPPPPPPPLAGSSSSTASSAMRVSALLSASSPPASPSVASSSVNPPPPPPPLFHQHQPQQQQQQQQQPSPPQRARMIGLVMTSGASPHGLTLGFIISARHWGRGYATEALSLFLRAYWSSPRRIPLDRLYASHHAWDPRGAADLSRARDDDRARWADPAAWERARPEREARDRADDAARIMAAAAAAAAEEDHPDAAAAAGGYGYGGVGGGGVGGHDLNLDPEETGTCPWAELEYLVALVDPDNARSIRVLEKNGGARGHTVRHTFPLAARGGEKRDMLLYRFDNPAYVA